MALKQTSRECIICQIELVHNASKRARAKQQGYFLKRLLVLVARLRHYPQPSRIPLCSQDSHHSITTAIRKEATTDAAATYHEKKIKLDRALVTYNELEIKYVDALREIPQNKDLLTRLRNDLYRQNIVVVQRKRRVAEAWTARKVQKINELPEVLAKFLNGETDAIIKDSEKGLDN